MKSMILTIRFYLLKLAAPVMRFLSKLHFPEPAVSAEFYYDMWDTLQPGDVLLSTEDSHFATNVLSPGFWAHAAIYCGETKFSKETVVEAIGTGVMAVPLVKWALVKDHICVLRFKGITPELGLAAAQEALKHVGEPYDYQFSGGNSAWYCSEIVWFSHWRTSFASGLVKPMELRNTFNVDTITPEDYFKATTKLDRLMQFGGPDNR